MLYVKVAVGLPVDGLFDYLVPAQMAGEIKPGSRVRVSFSRRKIVAYAAVLTKKTSIKKPLPILELIDRKPILGPKMLQLAKEIADYYCCSLGEAIEVTLPQAIRKGVPLNPKPLSPKGRGNDGRGRKERGEGAGGYLAHIPDINARWDFYLTEIKKSLAAGGSVIVLLPDMKSLSAAKERVSAMGMAPQMCLRGQPAEVDRWLAIKALDGPVVVMGLRSAVFAPIENLGLIIIEQEENFVYKQDQFPHYHARQAALMRSRIYNCGLILGSASPSLEAIYLARKREYPAPSGLAMATGLSLQAAPTPSDSGGEGERSNLYPQIILVGDGNYPKKKKSVFSKLLEDAIFSSLTANQKVLLFLNRRGFATSAACNSCGFSLKCPRCNINLVYHPKDNNSLRCHYCNFVLPAPKICPKCNAGYIRYSGAGTEAIARELSLVFPAAKIKTIESGKDADISGADIFVATSAITPVQAKFALVGVLSIDNSLNHPDLAASERAYSELVALAQMAQNKMIIQTGAAGHHCFQALLKNNPAIFYDEELRQRKQLSFPPYRHFILVKLRGLKEERVKAASEALFEKLNKSGLPKGVKIISLGPGPRPRLRDNFYRQILVSCGSVQRANKFIRFNLKDFPHSGIIVTVDVDPL